MTDLTPTQKGGKVMYWLMQGDALTVAQAASLLCVSRRRARAIFCQLEACVPIRRNSKGEWEMLVMSEVD